MCVPLPANYKGGCPTSPILSVSQGEEAPLGAQLQSSMNVGHVAAGYNDQPLCVCVCVCVCLCV